ncbi:MAG: hypothetical protein IPP21_12315 [Betaproteobacteria bacterium]|jgi:NAD(P)-dependent dehydrogenase (short-subunit alcohol dehydrogenase family)|nr:hypothetical protein [Betaproteobacteria bacterium]
MSKTLPITGAGAGIGRDAAFAVAACGRRVIAATCTEARRPRLRYVASWILGSAYGWPARSASERFS